jgi:predicted metal-binding membrane protein
VDSSTTVSVPALPRRDHIAILASLLGVTVLAWVYLLVMALDMGNMSSMESSDTMAMVQIHHWSALDFLLMFLMWSVMMVGMMVPTAIPMTLIYAAVARKAGTQGTTLAPAAVFVSGYVAMWTLFSVVATLAQWGLDEASLLSPMLVTTSPAVGAGLLAAAGVYQLTPFKKACLQHCRAPAHFISRHWRPGTGGAFRMGAEHGAFCLGCCWVLMGLLFFGGVMSLVWIAGISLFVLLEKVIPHGILGGRLAGIGLILTGGVVLVFWLI